MCANNPDRIKHIDVGTIKFDICYIRYIRCFINVCNQIMFKEFVSTSIFTLTYLHMQMVTHYFILSF